MTGSQESITYKKADGSVWAVVNSSVAGAEAREGRVVGWSGRVEDEDPARSAMRGWGVEGRALVDEAIAARLAAGVAEVVVLPRAGDAVSDLPSMMALLRRWDARPVKVLVDAELLMTPDMRRHTDDFTARCAATIEMLGSTGIAAACVPGPAAARLREAGIEIVNRSSAAGGGAG